MYNSNNCLRIRRTCRIKLPRRQSSPTRQTRMRFIPLTAFWVPKTTVEHCLANTG